jgi:hypothetical protein
MAIKRKAKRKTKKRNELQVRKAATRGKTNTVKKRLTKKESVRRPKKARSTAQGAVKPTRTSPLAPPIPSIPTQSPSTDSAEEPIGVVTHYYNHLSVATLRLESGNLRVGDVIHIRGHTTDFSLRVESLEVNRAPVAEVGPGDDFGLKVTEYAREHDIVYKVRS